MFYWAIAAIVVIFVIVCTVVIGRIRHARERRNLDRVAARLDQIMRDLAGSDGPPSTH